MTTVNYPSPVTVNGYSCKNCTDVDYAKQHIDPAHPKDGPYGVDEKNAPPKPSDPPAVTFGGVLAGVSQSATGGTGSATQGQRLDVSA
jgi:hypothetical protein